MLDPNVNINVNIHSNITISNYKGNTTMNLLCKAIQYNSIKYVEMFLDAGANVNDGIKEAYGATVDTSPLILAVTYGYIDIVRLLLERGADINVKSATGQTVYEVAINKKKEEISELLAEYGVNTATQPQQSNNKLWFWKN